MTEFLIFLTLVSVAYFGGKTLDRLPKHSGDSAFQYVSAPHYLSIEIDALTEENFEIGYVDDWEVGRPFMIGGVPNPPSEDDPDRRTVYDEIFGDRERVVIKVVPTAEWFQKSSIGFIRAKQPTVILPYQLAESVLREVRQNPDQVATVWYQADTNKKGETVWRIYTFELGNE